MRPEVTATPPARVLLTQGLVFDRTGEDAGLPDVEIAIPLAVDLAQVVSVRGYVDGGREGKLNPGRCVVTMKRKDEFTLAVPYEPVVSAWLAYRRHADQMGRIRN